MGLLGLAGGSAHSSNLVSGMSFMERLTFPASCNLKLTGKKQQKYILHVTNEIEYHKLRGTLKIESYLSSGARSS